MSAAANPDIVTDGLVFKYDTGDGKSYKGEPTVNLVGSMTKNFSNWNGLTGSTEYYTTSEGNQGVKLITTSSGGVQWYSNSTIYNIQSSAEYTISATVKYDGGTPHPNLLYVRQYDGNGQTSESGKFTTANQRDLGGGWKRIWRTFTTDSTTTHINLQGYEYSSGRTIYIQDLQFELKSHATQFAGASTTRSSTQGLLDRTGNTTINISNASFDSNAQMTFDGTDDQVRVDNIAIDNYSESFSYECVFKAGGTWANDYISNIVGIIGSYAGHYGLGKSGTNTINFVIRDDNYNSISATVSDTSSYHHLVGVWDQSNSQMRLYIDGELKNSATVTKTGAPDSNDLRIGGVAAFGGNNGSYYQGEIPIVNYYKSALTSKEAKQNYNATKSRFGL